MEIPDGLTNDVEVALSVVDQLPILVAGVEGPDLVVQLANAATRATVGGANFLGSRSITPVSSRCRYATRPGA